EKNDVAPDTVEPAELLADPEDTEADTLVQLEARLVLREDPGLDRPDPRRFRALDQRLEQQPADAVAARPLGDVDRILRDAVVDTAIRDRREGRPPDHLAAVECDEPLISEVAAIPRFPRRRCRLEGGIPRCDALQVDALDGLPMPRLERNDDE